eukprot:5704765-Pleurochrysis_carterae.AAC.1
MACLRVRGSVDAAQAANAQPVFRPHCGLSRRERSANSAAPRDLSGYGPSVRLNARWSGVGRSTSRSAVLGVLASWFVVTSGGAGWLVVMAGGGLGSDEVAAGGGVGVEFCDVSW